MQLSDAFENNRHWAAQKSRADSDYFERLAKGQYPDTLYIGCSDSRVTAEDMIGAEPGDLFVHRNIANVVPNTDPSSRAVINFAVDHLLVKNIVVCGHYGCGGVDAAMHSEDLGSLNPWLNNIRDVYRLHATELNDIAEDDRRYDRLVELNVQEQCLSVFKTPEVQRAINERSLRLHGWVFDTRTGRLIDLAIDFATLLLEMRKIYRLE